MAQPRVTVTAEDRERFARAREAGRLDARNSSAVVTAQYDEEKDAVELTFAGGGTMTILRISIPELAHASPAILGPISVSPAGDAVAWRSLDVDLHVSGLIERAFGTRLFASAAGRRGGTQRSAAKTAAARANGAKGGRPRKRPPA